MSLPIRDTETVIEAEKLRSSHVWMADSQMLWSDCYATWALAAAIAMINVLAPWRTFCRSPEKQSLGISVGRRRIIALLPSRLAPEYRDPLDSKPLPSSALKAPHQGESGKSERDTST